MIEVAARQKHLTNYSIGIYSCTSKTYVQVGECQLGYM